MRRISYRWASLLVLAFFIESCAKPAPEGWVLVKGGTAAIGDDVLSRRYEADIEDFWMAPYEATNADVAETYNWAFDRGLVYYLDEKIMTTKKLIPHFFVYPIIELKHKESGVEFIQGRLRPKKGMERHPMLWMSWCGAAMHCNFLSAMHGREPVYDYVSWEVVPGKNGYRLPTDAEWEYAARGGSSPSAFRYAGSDDFEAVAWFKENSGGMPHPVGQKAPNSLGLYDMSGNASEFMTDLLHAHKWIYDTPGYEHLIANRIWRGGSYFKASSVLFEYFQLGDWPAYSYAFEGVGFRPVLPRR